MILELLTTAKKLNKSRNSNLLEVDQSDAKSATAKQEVVDNIHSPESRYVLRTITSLK